MTKAEGRREFLARRKALSADEVEARSQQICQRFFENEWIKGQNTIHTFLPIFRHKEVNTWLIIHRIWREYPQTRVAVSITNTETFQLTAYELTPDTILMENQWGIPEPVAEHSLEIQTTHIDLVLVPLLLFDLKGHRVGYGGGFYDRFLTSCQLDCRKIGLSMFQPIKLISDILPTDIPLDASLTAEQAYYFT